MKARLTEQERREHRRAASRKYYHSHKEKCRAANTKWYASLSPERRSQIDVKKNKTRKRTVLRLRPRGAVWSTPQFDEAFALQCGVCAICSRALVPQGGIHVANSAHADHDHKRGLRRGILCSNCNTGLGMFKDNPEFLRAAAAYLETDHEVVREEQRASMYEVA